MQSILGLLEKGALLMLSTVDDRDFMVSVLLTCALGEVFWILEGFSSR